MKRSNKKFSKGSRRTRSVDRDQVPTVCPSIEDQLTTGKILRFTTTGGAGGTTSTTVTFSNLLDAWLIAGTAINGYQLFDFVKVHKVVIRAIPTVQTGATPSTVTVGVEYAGLVAGANAGGKQKSNTGVGEAFPAFVSVAPDRMSAAAFWQPSSNDVAFVVRSTNSDNTVCIGTIIDVHLAYKNSADVNPAAVSSAIAGATAGNLYYGGIDGGRLAATWARSVFVPRI